MVKIIIDGFASVSMKDGEEDVCVEEKEAKFVFCKKDESRQSISEDILPTGMIELSTSLGGQEITFNINLPDLARCVKFLEN